MTTLRDPSVSRANHTRRVDDYKSMAASALARASDTMAPAETSRLWEVPKHLARGLMARYGRGDYMNELQEYFDYSYVPVLSKAASIYNQAHPGKPLALHFEQSAAWMLLFALVCFDHDGSKLRRLEDWFTPDCTPVLYAMVLKGFVPGYAYKASYKGEGEAMAHEQHVVAALLQAPARWAGACDAFMRKWPKLMQRSGYREHMDDDKHPFNEFPLQLGVAVCAFDIDDTAFRDLPFYPRDLVDYYRSYVRNRRDAWRTGIIDPAPGLPEDARPQPKKIYAMSKTEAYARWVELVSGNGEQAARASAALGKRKTMPGLHCVTEALASVGLALHADIKDDETAEHHILALCDAHGLPTPDLPAAPPEGPARISMLLTALQAHAAQHAKHMAVLDNEDDAWHVVLLHSGCEQEFGVLCEQLGVRLLPDGAWE